MTTTANESLQRESQTESCETRRFLAISEHSSVKGTPTAIRDWLTLFLPASHVNHSASPASERETPTTEISGLKPSMSFAEYDQFMHTWRTYQVSLLTLTPDEFTETWPKAGMTVSGVGYPLPKQELRIAAIDGGLWPTAVAQDDGKTPEAHMAMKARMKGGPRYKPTSLAVMVKGVEKGMWPTPTKGDSRSSGSRNTENSKAHPGISLTDAVRGDGGTGRLLPTPCAADANRNGRGDLYARINNSGRQQMFPTPASRDYRSPNAKPYSERGGGKKGEQLPNAIGDQLNPNFVEWLMGWPYEHTSIDKGWLPFSREEITHECLREMWGDKEFASTPQGREFSEQLTREYPDLVWCLSHETALGTRKGSLAQASAILRGLFEACYSWPLRNSQESFQEAWQPATCETKGWIALAAIRGIWHSEWPRIPRVSTGVTNRVHRLKALGNGQVPAVVRAAWHLLCDD